MLQNWLHPINPTLTNAAYPKGTFGSTTLKYATEMPTLPKQGVAIIGASSEIMDPIRKELYKMVNPFSNLLIADLGDLKDDRASFTVQLFSELIESGIVPIIIGGSTPYFSTLFMAFQARQQMVNLAIVDKSFNVDEGYLSNVLSPPHANLYHVSLLGLQEQWHDFKLPTTDPVRIEQLSVGEIHSNFEHSEPLVRNADLMMIHSSAIRHSDLPLPTSMPTGLSIEEACQLARYGGLSDKLSTFGIFGYDPSTDQLDHAAISFATLVWYFIDGYHNRKADYPVSRNSLTKYIVFQSKQGIELTFWKSQQSSRWWMEVPYHTAVPERNVLIPCSEEDYNNACKEVLPQRLLSALERLS